MPHSNQSSTSSTDDGFNVYHSYATSSQTDPSVEPSDRRRHATQSQYQQQEQPLHQHDNPPFGYAPPLLQRHRDSSPSLANIPVPSFAAFRSQTPTLPGGPAGLGRKQQAGQSSPRINSFAGAPSPRVTDSFARPLSLDAFPQRATEAGDSTPQQTDSRSSFAFPLPPSHGSYPSYSVIATNPGTPLAPPQHTPGQLQGYRDSDKSEQTHHHYHHHDAHPSFSSSVSSHDNSQIGEEAVNRHSVVSMQESQTAPSMTLETNGVQRTLTDETLSSAGSHYSGASQQRPKSPAGKLGAFFGWKGSGSQDDSPTTTFSSEKSLSPLPSPGLRKSGSSTSMARLTPSGLDIQKANAQQLHNTGYFDNPGTPLLLGTTEQNAHVQELEKELHHISTELANSIRREMELEDELERVKLEIPIMPQEGLGRRSSDYFSDSGASSARFPVSDADAQIEKVEALRRKAEQEKAQVQLEMAERLQTELGRRKELEQLVHDLEEQLQKKLDQEDAQIDLSERYEELENTLGETRRLMGEERLAKDNFEVLYTATREELEAQRNERDNLRDEIVPQLKARVEGLEAEAEERDGLVYENTRMQQELKQLQEAHRAMKDGRFGSIAEEEMIMSPPLGPRSGVSRSGSLARSGSKRGGSLTRSGSLREIGGRARSGSTNAMPTTGALNAEGVKDIEDQRDALHKALQLLIKRYDKQQRDHTRAIRKLTKEKERADFRSIPKRTHYQDEVGYLKDEVLTLRKRTEDALEQKWQYEKGLSGLKIDLDRAEEETKGLRIVLEEQDVASHAPSSVDVDLNNSLRLTISNSENERDQALQLADSYRQRASQLQESPTDPEHHSQTVEDLLDASRRMDDLAADLEKQLQSNLSLRQRFAEAVSKGEYEQKASTQQIEEMQRRIALLEDSVLAAQQYSETTLSKHETEAREIEKASSPNLERLHIEIPEPGKLSPASPIFQSKSPKLSRKLSETSLLEMSRTQVLERKVRELEGLLKEAEGDMQAVISRVNKSQYEVAELQGERDAALTQMRKLQNMIVLERERAEAVM
ncbi:hypothetical protein K431DRAFT_333941 [Polychaeton citri CBS 116435]|uniref:DUF7603 domain-containing protein n=1 Tax=Polychaeton citri CBS 116435 TaxID=1314669 RepID=A0A9P4PZ01_9PEZI|nr:hypothetical protein K431DRAFT_333941 [Polychaeton citri CBS 116435]